MSNEKTIAQRIVETSFDARMCEDTARKEDQLQSTVMKVESYDQVIEQHPNGNRQFALVGRPAKRTFVYVFKDLSALYICGNKFGVE